MRRLLPGLTLLIAVSALAQDDTNCPAYPNNQRALWERSILRSVRTRKAIKPQDGGYNPALDVNFIDTAIFQQMGRDNIQPADAATDAEFMRRVTLDITGRIPSVQQLQNYMSSTDPGKKAALLARLTGASEYIDYWTHWFVDTFQVTADYYDFIGVPGRTLFYNFVRNFVTTGGSYQDFATQMITASGNSHQSGPPNYLMRGIQYSQPIQDTWDETTNRITTHFLGVQTTCVSCHDGKGHLEPINLYLSKRTRLQFWQQSAFLSRMSILLGADDAANTEESGYFSDRATGGYNSVLADPGNPGPRPPRTGGPWTPVYMFNSQAPATGAWRTELAKQVVNDRQFARAFVNYVWAHFFRVGIVDPPNAFDAARIDAAHPPTDLSPLTGQPWPLQPSNPALLEQLTDYFIQNGYRIAPVILLMAQSRAYGLSGTYNGTWTPLSELDYAKSLPRRLTAEELYDEMITATNTPVPMTVEGMNNTLYYAGQLPDATEPRSDLSLGNDQYNYINEFLTTFGRGDWWRVLRDNSLNPALMLYFMNSPAVVARSFGNTYQLGNSTVAQLATSTLSNADAINQLCLATLGRLPLPKEMATLLAYPPPDAAREHWLSDIQWVFLNEAEFFFNH